MWRVDKNGQLRNAEDMPATVQQAVAEIRELYRVIDERDATIRELQAQVADLYQQTDDPGVIRLPKWSVYESTPNQS